MVDLATFNVLWFFAQLISTEYTSFKFKLKIFRRNTLLGENVMKQN